MGGDTSLIPLLSHHQAPVKSFWKNGVAIPERPGWSVYPVHRGNRRCGIESLNRLGGSPPMEGEKVEATLSKLADPVHPGTTSSKEPGILGLWL